MSSAEANPRFRLLAWSRDNDLLSQLEFALRRQGFLVVSVRSAAAAVAAIGNSSFGGAIIDLRRTAISALGLLRSLYSSEGPQQLPLIFLVPSDIPQDDLEPLVQAGSYVIPLDEDVMGVLTQITVAACRLKDKSRGAAGALGLRNLSGDLSSFPLQEIFQWLHQGRKTGDLHLTCEGHEGRLCFVRGEVHHAELGELEGEEALRLLLHAHSGRFEFHQGELSEARTLTVSATQVLIDAIRRMDETKALIDAYTEARQRRQAGGSGQRRAVSPDEASPAGSKETSPGEEDKQTRIEEMPPGRDS